MQTLAYLIDVYTVNANSALSANTIVRSLVAGGFPLFAAPMVSLPSDRIARRILTEMQYLLGQ